jgi:hypothetical protein
LGITAVSAGYTVFVFGGAFKIFGGELYTFLKSFVRYLLFLVFDVVVVDAPTDGGNAPSHFVLPESIKEFKDNVWSFLCLLVRGRNFASYSALVVEVSFLWFHLLPLLVALWFLGRRYIAHLLTKHNNDYNADSRAFTRLKRLSNALYCPAKRFCVNLLEYIQKSRFPKVWLFIWLFNFNVYSILLSFVSSALTFVLLLKFSALYHLVYHAFVLAMPALRFIPIVLWVVVALALFDRWRKKIAIAILNYHESLNRRFILDRSICSMCVGTMGTGKTTLLTDMSLSTEVIFRNKADEIMFEIDCWFSNFPFVNFENAIKRGISAGEIFNLASCGEWVKKQRKPFDFILRKCAEHGAMPRHPKMISLAFEYDFLKYGLEYDDKKTVTYLFDALADYAKAYFIYIVQSSLILSNYAVRTDFVKQDAGNLPMWNLDFFEKSSRGVRGSRHSHVLDFDMLRLGKKLVKDNPNGEAFEFGCVVITEIGKERGNQFKTQEIKDTVKQLRDTIKERERLGVDQTVHREELLAFTERATQLTDKFNDSLKLIRHKATVCGFPFVHVFVDDQRPDSLGADARQLCEIIYVEDKGETRLAMPFFFLGELLYAFVAGRFRNLYREYRFHRGDNTAFMHCIKKVVTAVIRYHQRMYNRFGYHTRTLALEDGLTGAKSKSVKYYLSTKKIYSDRFATDAYYDIFARGLCDCGRGIDDFAEYKGNKATEAELLSQHSYFISDIVANATKRGDE